jgi:hypothetical protein
MKARRLIQAANFDEETLAVVFRAFDAAWAEIAHHFGDQPRDIEGGRLHLAHAILCLAHTDSRNAERLKNDALLVMAMSYKWRGRP